MKFLFICLFLFCIPAYSHAAIIINEVAWMGTATSANDEWIELYNDGSTSVSVDGWILKGGGDLEIVLAGAVGAGQYAVLERTDDDSAQGSAFLIYTGGLSNTGDKLTLYRGNSSVEDSVAGGENWQNIGGDNATKETAQYTTNGWITAEATPGKTNVVISTNTPDDNSVNTEKDDDKKNDSKSKTSRSPTVGTLHSQQREVRIVMDTPKRVYVNQEVEMSVGATGVSKPIVNSLEHNWNFGDFYTAQGSEVSHRFEYPGEYVVTLKSAYKEYVAQTRQSVTVLPVSFSITYSPEGNIQVHNNSKYEVDISGYQIFTTENARFPERTIMLPSATITIAQDKLNYIPGEYVALKDELFTVVATLDGVIPAPDKPTKNQPVVTRRASSMLLPNEQPSSQTRDVLSTSALTAFSFVGDEPIEVLKEPSDIQVQKVSSTPTIENSLQAAPIQATNTIPKEKLSYFALLTIIGLGILAVFAGRAK